MKLTGGCCSSRGERARSVVALAGNLDFLGSRFLTGLTAVLLARWRKAPAWQMGALRLLIRRHYGSPYLGV
jgi:hypothetical protein